MITGAHAVIYSRDAQADRAFFRDVLAFPHVDAGGGWLIFSLPPAEIALHPAEENGRQEIYLMCDDIEAVIRALQARGVACRPPTDEGWGLLTAFSLPAAAPSACISRDIRPPSMRPAGRRAQMPRMSADRICVAQSSLPMATAVSAMRLEKPHSLSYQDITRTSVPSITLVCSRWNTEECGSWLKSAETLGWSV